MNPRSQKPPTLARWILLRLTDYQEPYLFVGDLEESFHEIMAERGSVFAKFWFWFHTVLCLAQYAQNRIIWRFMMIGNYLNTTYRNIGKNKGYSAINIAGLSIGLACCILIALYVRFERSYDDYHDDHQRIYRIAFHQHTSNGIRSYAQILAALGPTLSEQFPQVENAVRMKWVDAETIKTDSEIFIEDKILCADPELFEIFHIPFIEGDAKDALRRPSTAVLTRSLAEKFFGGSSPIGRRLHMIGYDTLDVEITGVIEDSPANTHFKFGILTTMFLHERDRKWSTTHPTYTYVKLHPGSDIPEFETQLNTLIDQRLEEELKEYGYRLDHFLQPLQDIHLRSHLRNEAELPGNPQYLTIFSVIGVFILLMAMFNFMNLSTARSAERAREVGVRKVLGAHRRQLIGQFLGESMGFVLIALVLAFIIAAGLIPAFDRLTAIPLQLSQLFHFEVIILFILLAIGTGILAGCYPAFLLSAFLPVHVLHRGGKSSSGKHIFRSILVIGQFVISISLIIATAVIFRQVAHMRKQPLGFDTEQKLVIRFHRPGMIMENYESVKDELKKSSSILGATASTSIPGRRMIFWRIWPHGKREEQSQPIYVLGVDTDFFTVYGIRKVAGRLFDKEHMMDGYAAGWIFNESAVEAYGWSSDEEAVGQLMMSGQPIVGVIPDFHFKGLQNAIEPMGVVLMPQDFIYITLNVETADLPGTMAFVDQTLKSFFPDDVFDTFFLDADFNNQYRLEVRVGRIVSLFTILGIFIASLGLIGLASFVAERRTKEIGVRKVLGASVPGIVYLLSKEFIVYVIIANLIAWPVVFLAMKSWLNGFASRTQMGIHLYFGAALLVMMIALCTVSFQAIRAALSNPVNSLKYE